VLKHVKSLVSSHIADKYAPHEDRPLDELLALASMSAGSQRFILVFDQFEEYFVYNPPGTRSEAFDSDLARCANRDDIDAGLLISLRDDALSGLDRYQSRIPSFLAHSLRLNHLDLDSAREAIRGPVRRFNELRLGQDKVAQHVVIDDDLVEEVVNEVQVGKVSLSPARGKGSRRRRACAPDHRGRLSCSS
jgi:hypothetical protein